MVHDSYVKISMYEEEASHSTIYFGLLQMGSQENPVLDGKVNQVHFTATIQVTFSFLSFVKDFD